MKEKRIGRERKGKGKGKNELKLKNRSLGKEIKLVATLCTPKTRQMFDLSFRDKQAWTITGCSNVLVKKD